MKLYCLILAAFSAVAAAAPFSASNVLFGYAEKNGPMPPYSAGELVIFNHTCTTAPCVVTQMHVPSIYPGNGCPWDWENGVLRLYIDGEVSPSINITLLQLASVGSAGATGNGHKDISPFAAGHLFGKNAQTGGVWTTIRIPFASTLRVTLQQSATCDSQSTYWFIIRGVEGLTISLGEIDLPPQARLVQSTILAQTFQAQAYVPLANASAGSDGMLVYTFVDATSADPNYLEGCFHITGGDGREQFLSSGTEDYFLSASYFDEGTFAESQSGYVFAGAGGSKSMYKTHDSRDLIPFHGGMHFVWRNNEDGQSCPNHFQSRAPARRAASTGPMTLTSIVFFYAWPLSSTVA